MTLSYADISTLGFNTLSTTSESLNSALNRVNPSEIIIPDSLLAQESFKRSYEKFKEKLVTFADSFFDIKKTAKKEALDILYKLKEDF
jgi:DNA mismatch repair ATPase MutS